MLATRWTRGDGDERDGNIRIPRRHSVGTRVLLSAPMMLRPSLLRRISRYSSVYTPTRSTANQLRALPLSDAQRKTIYALSTPPAKSGVAVIRISGPDALHVWQRMVRSTRAARTNQDKDEPTPKPNRERKDGTFLPEAWKLQRCHVVDPQTSELLDDALAVFFRGAPPRFAKSQPILPLTREGSAPLVHYRGRSRTTRTRRTRHRRCGTCRARTHSGVSPRYTGRVYAPRVRGRSARSHAG